MTTELRAVLIECLKREDALKTAAAPPKWQTWEYEPYLDELEFGPAWAPADWFGGDVGLTDAQRMRFVRAVHAAATAGLVTITLGPDGRRIAHVQLTDAGRSQAGAMLSATA
jgi:hypothetical protein